MRVRVKSFEATGQPLEGRLYAGDLNAIQDAAAAQVDFQQQIDLGTVRVGDPTLMLSRYGTGAFRMTGKVLTDGLVSAGGGLVSGYFTTAQRNAIVSGNAPQGTIIFNLDTVSYQWNAGTDTARNWQELGANIPPAAIGTLGTRPSANSVGNKQFYFATDDLGGTLYLSDGTNWLKSAKGLSERDPQSLQVLDRVYTITNVTGSGPGETNLYLFSIPAGTMGINSMLELLFFGYEFWGGGNISWRFKFGSYTLGPVTLAGGSTGNTIPLMYRFYIQNKGVANSQEIYVRRESADASQPGGSGFFGGMGAQTGATDETAGGLIMSNPVGASSIDTTQTQSLIISAQVGSSSTTIAGRRMARLTMS